MTDDSPFQRLSDRITGRPVHRALIEDVPEWFEGPLRDWIDTALRPDFLTGENVCRTIVLQLEMPQRNTYFYTLANAPAEKLLDVVDAILHNSENLISSARWTPIVEVIVPPLQEILKNAKSAYTVGKAGNMLQRRVDPTVTESFTATLTTAEHKAADHLQEAWAYTYGLHPKPTEAYGRAVKAVESLLCPLVLSAQAQQGNATMGKALGTLRATASRWELALPNRDDQPDDIDHFLGAMTSLWEGNRGRHEGSSNSREHTQKEAERATSLAVYLVQQLTLNTLRPRAKN